VAPRGRMSCVSDMTTGLEAGLENAFHADFTR
jgi:hypothetical protein